MLDAVNHIQATQANDLASSMELQGRQMRLVFSRNQWHAEVDVHDAIERSAARRTGYRQPMKAFPVLKDLITDVSWNFRVKKKIKKFKPRAPDAADGTWRMQQEDIDRVQEFRKCIECFLCQDVCHVSARPSEAREFIGPRFLSTRPRSRCIRSTPKIASRNCDEAQGIGYCNITKCCTKVCPENIQITDNGIIPLKERVVDGYYDPLGWVWKGSFDMRR